MKTIDFTPIELIDVEVTSIVYDKYLSSNILNEYINEEWS